MQERLAGRYVLGAELGRGGMARVVVARDLRLHRQVAVKLLPVSAAEPSEARQRFVREARAAAAFSHPHAVAIFDAGVADDVLFIVMELVDGETVATRVGRRGPLDVAQSLRIMDEVLQALAAAHRAGIVHRDVKPGNVLLTADGTAKLADFGIAKRLDDGAADVTIAGHVIGTPSYLAPEQLAGGRVTPAVDIYAAGVLLFEMLTGRKPYVGNNAVEIALARRASGPADVRELRADVPPSVAAAIRTALAEDPRDRFGSADAMRASLRGTVVTTPAPAAGRPLPPPEPLAPTAVMPVSGVGRRRHLWWWLALAAAVVVAVVAVALGRDTDRQASGGAATTAAPVAVAPSAVAPTTVAPTTVAATPPPTAAAAPTAPPATTPPAPSSIEELVVVIGADPARFGVHADQLQGDLARLADRDGRQQARDVERLLGRLDDWTGNGSLSPEAADLIRSLLPSDTGDEGDGDNGD